MCGKPTLKFGDSLFKRLNALLSALQRTHLGIKLLTVDLRKFGHALAQLLLNLPPQIASSRPPGLQQPRQPPTNLPQQIPIPHRQPHQPKGQAF